MLPTGYSGEVISQLHSPVIHTEAIRDLIFQRRFFGEMAPGSDHVFG